MKQLCVPESFFCFVMPDVVFFKGRFFRATLCVAVFLMAPCLISEAGGQETSWRTARLERTVNRRLPDIESVFSPWEHLGRMRVDSFWVNPGQRHVTFFMHQDITHLPLRYPAIRSFENEIINRLGWRFRNYSVSLWARGRLLYDFVPNYFRTGYMDVDTSRYREMKETVPLIRRPGSPPFEAGLQDKHIALWHSHGMYYDAGLDRWQWQRARLFGTVEDVFPMAMNLQFLTPMLELAGATVFMPRERDIQSHEVVIDIEGSTGTSEVIVQDGLESWQVVSPGFARRDTLFDGDNPFLMGYSLRIAASADTSSYVRYIPDIPEDGYYAVYASWADSPEPLTEVACRLRFAGGEEFMLLNQQMARGTWVYLGTYYFREGKHPEQGSLDIYGYSEQEGYVTADAVRFGGGMGSVARRPGRAQLARQRSVDDRGIMREPSSEMPQTPGASTRPAWKTSGHPRYVEGARYYLQYAGMPDTLVYSLNRGMNDYNDDFQSRGEWVNYLMGSPLGPLGHREETGLGIPIDLSLAIHTDAGVTQGDSVIGTLAIYSARRDEGYFPDGLSRLASRDLADLVQHQLIWDIRQLYKPDWTRRAIWDRQYSEAWRPNVPALLLELFSHQNLSDMSFGLDPRFQFDASRAIYKGILRYLAHKDGREAVVAPLPPVELSMQVLAGDSIRVSWKGVDDPLEPTATPTHYILYLRKEGEGFARHTITGNTHVVMELPERGKLTGFRVSAVNRGGESFPSETLSMVLLPDDTPQILVVNAFDRVSGPSFFDTPGFAGIAWWEDGGVPYQYKLTFTGSQYDFRRDSPWLDDDSPGWGASYADQEAQVIPGNSFDFPWLYGEAIRQAGYSYASVSRKAFEQPGFDTSPYSVVIVIGGLQKGVPHFRDRQQIDFRLFTPPFIEQLSAFAAGGGSVFLSGAYIGTDMVRFDDEDASKFAQDVLGYTWRTNHATNQGEVMITDYARGLFPAQIRFNAGFHPDTYRVEAPDAIEAAGEHAFTIYRYATGMTSAGVAYAGEHRAVSLGFPFESVPDALHRSELMKSILDFLMIKPVE